MLPMLLCNLVSFQEFAFNCWWLETRKTNDQLSWTSILLYQNTYQYCFMFTCYLYQYLISCHRDNPSLGYPTLQIAFFNFFALHLKQGIIIIAKPHQTLHLSNLIGLVLYCTSLRLCSQHAWRVVQAPAEAEDRRAWCITLREPTDSLWWWMAWLWSAFYTYTIYITLSSGVWQGCRAHTL